jgi:hypothetical protein
MERKNPRGLRDERITTLCASQKVLHDCALAANRKRFGDHDSVKTYCRSWTLTRLSVRRTHTDLR